MLSNFAIDEEDESPQGSEAGEQTPVSHRLRITVADAWDWLGHGAGQAGAFIEDRSDRAATALLNALTPDLGRQNQVRDWTKIISGVVSWGAVVTFFVYVILGKSPGNGEQIGLAFFAAAAIVSITLDRMFRGLDAGAFRLVSQRLEATTAKTQTLEQELLAAVKLAERQRSEHQTLFAEVTAAAERQRVEHQTELAGIQSARERLRAQNEIDLAETWRSTELRRGQLQIEHENELAELKEATEQQRQALRVEHENELSLAKTMAGQRLQEQQILHAEELATQRKLVEQLRGELTQAADATEQLRMQHQAALAEIAVADERRHNEQRIASERELAQVSDLLQNLRAGHQAAAEEALAVDERLRTELKVSYENELVEIRRSSEQKRIEQQNDYLRELEEIRKSADERRNQLQQNHLSEMSELRKLFEQLRGEKAQADKSNERLRLEQNNAIAETRIAGDRLRNEQRVAHEEDLLKFGHAEEQKRRELQVEHEKQIAQLHVAMDELRSEHLVQLASAAKAQEALRGEHRKKLAEAKQFFERVRGERQNQLADAAQSMEQLRADHQKALAAAWEAAEQQQRRLEHLQMKLIPRTLDDAQLAAMYEMAASIGPQELDVFVIGAESETIKFSAMVVTPFVRAKWRIPVRNIHSGRTCVGVHVLVLKGADHATIRLADQLVECLSLGGIVAGMDTFSQVDYPGPNQFTGPRRHETRPATIRLHIGDKQDPDSGS